MGSEVAPTRARIERGMLGLLHGQRSPEENAHDRYITGDKTNIGKGKTPRIIPVDKIGVGDWGIGVLVVLF